MTKASIYFFLCLILLSSSCNSQVNSSNDSIQNEFSVSKKMIYDTCTILEIHNLPSNFRFDFIPYKREKGIATDASFDSVLAAKISYSRPRDFAYEDFYKCKNLGFLNFSKHGSPRNFSKELDFSYFPELRYFRSPHAITKQQLRDLLTHSKKLQGLELKLDIPVPECICELENLRYLTIINYGTSLPPCIKNMNSLRYLALGGGGILSNDSLNEIIFNIPSLEVLLVDGGRNLHVPASVKNMNHLKQLIVTSLDSLSFAPEFEQLDSLELLEVRWIDKPIRMPENLKSIKSLRGISFSKVSLNKIPSFEGHQNLIYIAFNSIRSLESTSLNFGDMTSLKYLKLQGPFDDVSTFPQGLASLDSLRSIWLMGFNITEIPDYLGRMKSLRELSLMWTEVSPESYYFLLSEEFDHLKTIRTGSVDIDSDKVRELKRKRRQRLHRFVDSKNYSMEFERAFGYYKQKIVNKADRPTFY